ncbi:Outer membrane lipoprotein Blc [Zhongshania aliphaticivorans]|uniref:Outer membrane lipoprotein Blc n=2 Tax=Zhongshania aliphaticivorans TaxID=1470434 RepID=A0A5S9N773_9GAMM|nr:Outer membrane lipoprotein Blc [Zhongshania aliphaticivorans]CAA0084799.1 Outer membrane lipoprotein Blc [Zhongshania aliphaticivorans]
MKKLIGSLSALLVGCMGMPESVSPVQNFEIDQFLGKWYEIARLDHSFERGMSQVSAEYSLRDDGGVKVLNKGYKAENQEWKEAEGKAYFVGSQNEGYLKVSFFGPFYSSYVVYELEENYQYAFVSGANTDYLWLLSRSPEISAEVRQKFIEMSADKGFDTESVIWVDHSEAMKGE